MIRCNSKIGQIFNTLADRGEIEPVTITWPGTELAPIICNSMWAATDYLRTNGFYNPGTPLHRFA